MPKICAVIVHMRLDFRFTGPDQQRSALGQMCVEMLLRDFARMQPVGVVAFIGQAILKLGFDKISNEIQNGLEFRNTRHANTNFHASHSGGR
jgi:hypothetical protein